jgi:flagellar protein FliL
MAEKEKDGEGGDAEKPKGGKKKLIIIIVAVLILVGGGAGAFMMMGGKDDAAEEEGGEGEHGEEAAEGEEGVEGELPGAMMPLETFIVNLRVKGSFLKITMSLEFGEPELPHTAENDVPKIRDAVIRLLAKKDAQELLSPEGKEKLDDEIKDGVNQVLGSEDVVAVYITEFIIQ